MMRLPTRKIPVLVLCATIVAAGCSQGVVKSLTSLNRLQQRLTRNYGDVVNVNLQNSRYLLVAFINSPLNQADRGKRYERAQDAAKFVGANYEEIKSVEQIWISFMASETRFIFLHYTRGLEAFGFRQDGTPLRDYFTEDFTDTHGDDIGAPVIRYSTTTRQTDVSVTRLQLDGDINKGIALVPHFLINGDARRAGNRLPPPAVVTFDFASYSPKPLFSGNTSLEVYCDDRLVSSVIALLLSKNQTGTETNIAQFLTTSISYKVFYQMAKAHKVRIRLGARDFELAREDIQSLNRMTEYAAAPGLEGDR